jgi:hypothetical protein
MVHHRRLDPGLELIAEPFTYPSTAEIRDVLDAS